jgi:hypothetical protein
VIDANIFTVAELLHLQSGYPFRGSIEESSDGDALAVQMKDVDPEHGVNWSGVLRTMLTGRKQPDWLKSGDILVVSKGARFYAVCLNEPPHPAVCSPHFFHLQVSPSVAAIPAFIAWQINQPPFQRQLQQAAEGTSQLSIRRPVLEALTLSIHRWPINAASWLLPTSHVKSARHLSNLFATASSNSIRLLTACSR